VWSTAQQDAHFELFGICIARATEAAAISLGWTSPDAAEAALLAPDR